MGLTQLIKDGDWVSIRQAIAKLAKKLDYTSSPTFAGIVVTGLTASRLVSTNATKGLASVSNLASWVAGTANEIDVADDGDGSITIGLVNPLIVGKGGTGVATLTDHGLLLGSGTDAITPLGVATNGQIPIGSTGLDPVLATITAGTGIGVANTAGAITVSTTITQYTDELAQDAVGGMVANSATINLTYTDLTPSLIADLNSTLKTNYDSAYTHSGLVTGNPHSVTKSDVGLGSVENTALSTWVGTTNITTLGTVATGVWNGTDIAIADGGTGQGTAQLAINALSAVGAATNEHVLTKDTVSGNAIFKAAAGGSDVKVAVDAAATAGYLGAANADVLRTSTGITKTDGGDFITLTTNDSQIAHDSLSGYSANKHVDHTAVTLTAGTGMSGGGDISANRTFNALGVLADGTSGRTMRSVYLLVQNGTNAATLKCEVINIWNGDTVASTDNIAKGATTGVFNMEADGSSVYWLDTGITGDSIYAIGNLTNNTTGTQILITVIKKTSPAGIEFSARNVTTGTQYDLTTLVDSGNMTVQIMYLTSA